MGKRRGATREISALWVQRLEVRSDKIFVFYCELVFVCVIEKIIDNSYKENYSFGVAVK